MHVYPTESYFVMLEEGGLVWGDGYGGEIRMVGGCITFSAPGDIIFQSGRNTVTMAGRDAIIKALNSVDVTASTRDVRIKADHNLMALAGNDGCGGILLQSNATCPAYDFEDKSGEAVVTSGIVLQAKTSQVVAQARDVILKSGFGAAGDIILDADSNRIKTVSDYFDRFVSTSAMDFFGPRAAPTSTNEYLATSATINSTLQVGGNLVVEGCEWLKNWLIISDGHIATSGAASTSGLVDVADSTAEAVAASLFTAMDVRKTYLDGVVGPSENTKLVADVIVETKGVEFSLRRSEDYKLDSSFALFESRWQQLARLGGTVMPTWTESYVTTSDPANPQTYPWPGSGATTAATWYTQDLSLYDVTTGVSIQRGTNQADYETPTFQAPTATVLNGNYTVVNSD